MLAKFTRVFRKLRVKILRTLDKFNSTGEVYLVLLAVFVGILTGFGAYLLNLIIEFVHVALFDQAHLNLISNPVMDYLRILFPAIGGLAVGLLVYHFSPEVKGHGIPGVMEAVANKGGYIRKRVSFLTSINSGLTIGSGGSAGKEGPIVQIGAAIGSSIGQLLNVSQQRMKILAGCGTAAGLAAVFNAPIAGVVFTMEIILADYSLRAFTPIVVSSVIATVISRHFIDSGPILQIPVYALNSPWELPFYLMMGLLGGVLSVIFIKTLYGVEELFEEKLSLPTYIKPAIGGLATGLIAYCYPQVYGFDDSAIYSGLLNQPGVFLLLILIGAKILATSFTLGSGATGGLFTPSLFIGAMFGGLFGILVGNLFPDIAADPGAYALVGMAVIVAGTIHAPLSAFLMIFEVTGDYNIILPLMLGAVSSTVIARWLEKESIYTMKISLFSSHLLHGRNLELMKNIKVASLIQKDADVIGAYTGLSQILDIFMKSNYTSFPVLDKNKKVIGIITLRDLRLILNDRQLEPFLIAMDIMSENVFILKPEDTINQAIQKMEIGDYELLPVVDSDNTLIYQGVVSKNQILKLYTKKDLFFMETES